jgi:hypothetical protein
LIRKRKGISEPKEPYNLTVEGMKSSDTYHQRMDRRELAKGLASFSSDDIHLPSRPPSWVDDFQTGHSPVHSDRGEERESVRLHGIRGNMMRKTYSCDVINECHRRAEACCSLI